MKPGFEERYREGDLPWDHGMPDTNLQRIVERFRIPQGKALDIGCGTGENILWLSRAGFTVTGCDLSPTAIEMAQAKSGSESCHLFAADFITAPITNAPFDLAFDRGCFHSVRGEGAREAFPQKVASVLKEGGLWLSIIGNADEPKREVGPPQMTAREIAELVEPHFEILSLESGVFGSDQQNPPRAWIVLLRRRT